MSFKILIKEANTRTISQAFGWLQPFKLHPSFHESNVAGVYGGKIARKKNKLIWVCLIPAMFSARTSPALRHSD
jgi:hypothetical protein